MCFFNLELSFFFFLSHVLLLLGSEQSTSGRKQAADSDDGGVASDEGGAGGERGPCAGVHIRPGDGPWPPGHECQWPGWGGDGRPTGKVVVPAQGLGLAAARPEVAGGGTPAAARWAAMAAACYSGNAQAETVQEGVSVDTY